MMYNKSVWVKAKKRRGRKREKESKGDRKRGKEQRELTGRLRDGEIDGM